MNAIGVLFTLLVCLLQLALPRRLAMLPLLVTFAWMTRGQVLDLGGATFTVLRIVIGVGCLRALLRGEGVNHGMNRADVWMLVWATWLLAVAPFHASGAALFRLGLIWDYLGGYFLARIFLKGPDDIVACFKTLCLLFVPIAISMVIEKYTGHNAFGGLGGVNELATVREGHVRASGPFVHPILAGTVGAALIPMALLIRKTHRWHARLGLVSGAAIVFASTSSGPILMELFIVFALWLWRFRKYMSAVRWSVFIGILCLAAVMKDPVYFIMAKVDFAGGSTGWHRAQLIRSSLEHLDEWWIVGTDHTRHWMPTGVYASAENTDITNHYLSMGVMGGLPLIAIFMMILLSAFSQVSRALRDGEPSLSMHEKYMAWTIGAILFGHAMNFLSISLFDHSIIGFLLLLAMTSALRRDTVTVQGGVQQNQGRPAQVLARSFY